MLTFFANLAEILAGLIKAGKWPVVGAFIIIAGFGGLALGGKAYVDDKIDAEKEKTQQMIATLTVMQGTLTSLSETVKDVKDAVKTSDQTARETQKMVIDIYRNNRGG